MGEICSAKVCVFSENRFAKVRVLGEACPTEVGVFNEGRPGEVCAFDEDHIPEARVFGEGRPAESCGSGEGCPVEARALGEGDAPEVRALGECNVPEACILDEPRSSEVCSLGEGRLVEVCSSGKDSLEETRFTIESGRSKISFFNREVAKRIENQCSAEIKIEVAPWARSNRIFGLHTFRNGTTTLAHFGKNSSTYILFFTKLCIVCSDFFRIFIIIRIF